MVESRGVLTFCMVGGVWVEQERLGKLIIDTIVVKVSGGVGLVGVSLPPRYCESVLLRLASELGQGEAAFPRWLWLPRPILLPHVATC